MKTKKDYSPNHIELRSEKVRNIIGIIPQSLVYWGIAIITIIFVILMSIIFLVSYPYGAGETIFQHLFFSQ